MNEIWRNVVGFEGHYMVSNAGRVKSMKFGRIRVLSSCISPNGYERVIFSLNNNKTVPNVHVLVTEAFHGAAADGWQVCHSDGDKLNNRANNLRWGTARENSNDRWHHGTMMCGENNPMAKLCNLDVWLIRNTRCRNKEISDFLGISKYIVSRVRSGQTYTERNMMRASQ